MTTRAAGIMFQTPDKNALFLKRSGTGDHAGEWCFPGGGIEGDETPEAAARREAREETRPEMFLEGGPMTPHHRAVSDEGVEYTTFAQPVVEAFTPTLNEEHTEFVWASLNAPPLPLHPGVSAMLQPSHAQDESMRSKSPDGSLHINTTNISKANVCGYLGREVPDFETLGLDPERMYQLLRDPEELAKAAPTFNNLPLLAKHVPVSADAYPAELVIGSTGTDAEFTEPYMRNSLVVWKGDDIRDIENEVRKELSSAYRYSADMTPGTYKGVPYDGVMRNIIGNHVALVKEGRAGPDVVVGDAATIKLKELTDMTKLVLSRKATMVQGALAVFLRPKLAQDAKIDLAPMLVGVSDKTFKAKSPDLVTAITKALEGKLAKDANLADLPKVMDELSDVPVQEGLDADPNSGLPMGEAEFKKKTMDADPCATIQQLLQGKVDDQTIAAVLQAIKGPAPTPAPVAPGLDAEPKDDDKVTKPAMDQAIKVAVDATTKRLLDNARAVRDAEKEVRPYVGEIALACDSAEDVYRTALKGLGVEGVEDVKELPALKAILKAQTVPGTKKAVTSHVAMDAKSVSSYNDRFPEAGRIGNLG